MSSMGQITNDSQDSSIEFIDSKTCEIRYFSRLAFFLLIIPWVVGGMGVIIMFLPLFKNIHTPDFKAMWLILPGLLMALASIPLYIIREQCDDCLVLDREQRTIFHRITVGSKTLDRCVESFDNVYCVTYDACPGSDDGRDTTSYWGCIVFRNANTWQITSKVWLINFANCASVTAAVAEILQCELIAITFKAPVLQVSVNAGGNPELRHREPRAFDYVMAFVPILLVSILLCLIPMGIVASFCWLFGIDF